MDHFEYRDGRLTCEGVDLGALAARVGTPTYVYSRATLLAHYDRLAEAFAPLRPLICYSAKSNGNLAVLRALVERGAGVDVVSGGELHRARLVGCPMSRVVYAGVGKTEEEVLEALGVRASSGQSGMSPRAEPIGVFNIESEQEFHAVAAAARAAGVVTRGALRVNPDVDPATHRHTTTGTATSKFGVDLRRAADVLRRFAAHPNLRLTGVHLHLGSPVRETGPYVEAIRRALALIDGLARDGVTIDTLDLGGGFAADYRTGQSLTAADYAAAIVPLLRERVGSGALRIILEPGRFISANAGVLLTRVQYVKTGGAPAGAGPGGATGKKFVICDAGMHTLIRPALYEAFHFVWPVSVGPQHEPARREESPEMPGLEVCDVVGPICESADFLAQDRALPPVARGDLLAVFAAGAYGMSMANRYNSHPLPAEVMVDRNRARLVRRRETYEDLVEHERIGLEEGAAGDVSP